MVACCDEMNDREILSRIRELTDFMLGLREIDKGAFRADLLTLKDDLEESRIEVMENKYALLPSNAFSLLSVNRFLLPSEISQVRSVLLSLVELHNNSIGKRQAGRLMFFFWLILFQALINPAYQQIAKTLWGMVPYSPEIAKRIKMHSDRDLPADYATFNVSYPSLPAPVKLNVSSVSAHEEEKMLCQR